ncbi:MAG: ribosome biogenesis GTPase Der [Alphaproteobacteria bacterium]
MSSAFEVALVGRPNVGKSTLFNRLVGRRVALVDDQPGVTRDRRSGEARLGDLSFTVVDTAGLADAPDESLEGRMRRQTEAAVMGADLSLFIIDARDGVTPIDEAFARVLRKTGKPIVVVANKTESRSSDAGVVEAFSLGFGDPVPVSAEHGQGLGTLHDAIAIHMSGADDEISATPPAESEPGLIGGLDPERPLKIVVVGRPNAGKSTLINRIIGEDRLLTGPEAGITRDSIAVEWSLSGRHFRLFDTAGMRRKARVQEKLEKLSVADALLAIRFSEVVILTIDATQPFDRQDLQIADLVEREGRALVIALNKWDLVTDKQRRSSELNEEVTRLLPQLRGVPLVTLSAEKATGLDRLMQAVVSAHEIWNQRVGTAELNRWLSNAVEAHTPPAVSGRRIKLRYMTQPKARPPTFVIFCSRPEALPDSYKRFLVNGLREAFALDGVPIRVALRRGENPYAGKANARR